MYKQALQMFINIKVRGDIERIYGRPIIEEGFK